MRRLPSALALAALALAVAAGPSLAARHASHPRAKTTAYARSRSTRASTTKNAAGDLLRSGLAPSVPADPTIDGAKPGALPWRLRTGDVLVSPGHLQVHLIGFVIPGKGVGPVKTVDASLYCNGDAKPAATTGPAALSSAGDAAIDTAIAVPKTCIAPIVLVHPNGAAASYVAASGWVR